MQKLKLIWGLLRVFLPEPLVRFIYAGRLTTIAGRQIDPKAQAATDLVTLLRDPDQPPTLEQSRAQIATLASKFERPPARPPSTKPTSPSPAQRANVPRASIPLRA